MNTEKTVFYLDIDPATRLSHIVETTERDFLLTFCESDPSRAFHIVEVDDFEVEPEELDEFDNVITEAIVETRYEVRMNPYNQTFPNKLFDTFETEEEADEFILKGLRWNLNEGNGIVNPPPYSYESREELEALLKEQGVSFTTEHRIAQIKQATSNRKERLQQERAQRLAAFAGDDAAVIREWWASKAYHPAPKEVMDIKAKLGLNWKQVRAIAKSV